MLIPCFKDWPGRVKFVDDTTAIEVIPRCSPSFLPIVVNQISDFANERGMVLNPKKCKEMITTFLKYRHSENDIFIGDVILVETVNSFKLLGVWLTNNLSWELHVDKLLKKTNSRIYALRLLKKAGLNPLLDIVHIYCSFIKSQIEYASPVWSGLPNTLSVLLEAVQKRALKIAYPSLSYEEALEECGLDLLSKRRDMACQKLLKSIRNDEPPYNSLTNIVRPFIPQ